MRKLHPRLFLLVLSVSPCLVSANEESHRKTAEEFLEVTNTRRNLSQSIEQMLDFQVQRNPRLTPYRDMAREFLEKHMSWDSLKEEIISIYLEEFTEPELRELVAFYRTPTGQKAIQRLPEIMAKGAQIGAQRVQENLPELQRMIDQRTKELQEGGSTE